MDTGAEAAEPAGWPRRQAVCIDCRTAQSSESCMASGRHRMARLDDEHGREALLTEVWGPPSRRRRARELAAASAGGVAGGSVVDGCMQCSGCELATAGEAAAAVVVVIVAAIVFVILYFAIKALVRAIQRRRHRLKPAGALARGAKMGHGHDATGTVEAAHTQAAPLTGEACVAYSVIFRHKRRFAGSDVMLRDACTIGFDVRLDSGELARIPAGPCVIDMHGAERVRAGDDAVEAYLRELDPRRPPVLADEYDDPLPRQVIWHRALAPGARVTVRGPLRPSLDAGAATAAGYRDSAATVLVPEGVPRIVVE